MTLDAKKKKGLGRGLSALLGDDVVTALPAQDGAGVPGVEMAPLASLEPNPDQPRKQFNEDDLEDLAASIREKGILQPIVVRRNPRASQGYEIIAGERRWRAAQRAGMESAPVIIRDFSDAEALEIAIIENVQRADLNGMEEAQGYAHLVEAFDYTQEQLSKVVGKSRSHIANALRLMKLPDMVQTMVRDGQLSSGHARTLVGKDDAPVIARLIVDKGLSVREAEKLAQRNAVAHDRPKRSAARKDADTLALEGDLSAALGGAPVSIEHKGDKGRIVIRYDSLDRLDDLCGRLANLH